MRLGSFFVIVLSLIFNILYNDMAMNDQELWRAIMTTVVGPC
jgi:hypothetical protein